MVDFIGSFLKLQNITPKLTNIIPIWNGLPSFLPQWPPPPSHCPSISFHLLPHCSPSIRFQRLTTEPSPLISAKA